MSVDVPLLDKAADVINHQTKPIRRGMDEAWRIFWDALDVLTPYQMASMFYIATMGFLIYLEATSDTTGALLILDQIGISPLAMIVLFGVSAWVTANVRTPRIVVLFLMPMFLYGVALMYGGLVAQFSLRGSLAAVYILGLFLMSLVALRNYHENKAVIKQVREITQQELKVINGGREQRPTDDSAQVG